MRFLADESCDFNVVRALRAAGFDVLAVAEVIPRATDDRVIERTAAEDRILLTEDKDFGQLVYASAEPSPGVVLIRFPARARQSLSAAMLELIRRHGERLREAFVVLQPRSAGSWTWRRQPMRLDKPRWTSNLTLRITRKGYAFR